MSNLNKCYTITYGDVAENHARMQQIGTLHASGYSIEKIRQIQAKLNEQGLRTELIILNRGPSAAFEPACVLVIREGVQHIFGKSDTTELIAENDKLTMDKHALMRGRVVNKHARWNLCFSDGDQEPDYASGKGRIVSWQHIPMMAHIRQVIAEWTDDVPLNAEANYYYDVSKCGIGYHGDAERRKVVAVRMGASMPLYYQWYQHSNPIGEPIEVSLGDGDMYIMSEKAVGQDWLKKNVATLRHATGCKKYTNV